MKVEYYSSHARSKNFLLDLVWLLYVFFNERAKFLYRRQTHQVRKACAVNYCFCAFASRKSFTIGMIVCLRDISVT